MAKIGNLTPKQKAFCYEYVIDFNGTQAYGRVYKNANYNTCQKNSHDLLKKPEIKEEIQRIQKELFEAKMINFERIADAIAEIAFDETTSKADRLKALNLLQKQFGLEKTTVAADVNSTINIKVGIEEDGD